jgi:hypothetical protein
VAAVALLGACGDDEAADAGPDAVAETGGSSSEGGETTADCPSDAGISDAVGAEVALDPSSSIDDLGCNYYSDDGVVSVGVVVEAPASRTIDDVRRNLEVEDVAGIGDEAVISLTPGGIAQLTVADGDRLVLVTVSGVDDPEAGAIAAFAVFG